MTLPTEHQLRYSMRQLLLVLTVFGISFGFLREDSFSFTMAVVIAAGISCAILLTPQRAASPLIVKAVSALGCGLLGALLYALIYGPAHKGYQILAASGAALAGWTIAALVGILATRMRTPDTESGNAAKCSQQSDVV